MKLNLGCGKLHREGYVGIDFNKENGAEVIHDLKDKLPYEDNTIDEIYASHIIEHFWWETIPTVLKDWYRVLKKGGVVDIWTVDFDKLIYHFMNHQPQHFKKTMVGINWRLFATNRFEGDAHHSMFNARYLGLLLSEAGFTKISRIPDKEFPFKPMHEGINLGVRAEK